MPVGPELLARLPVTLELAVLAFLIANLIAVPLGALAAYCHQRKADIVITFLATVLGAIPNFWLATLLILVFALTLRWLPAGGFTPFVDDPVAEPRADDHAGALARHRLLGAAAAHHARLDDRGAVAPTTSAPRAPRARPQGS